MTPPSLTLTIKDPIRHNSVVALNGPGVLAEVLVGRWLADAVMPIDNRITSTFDLTW